MNKEQYEKPNFQIKDFVTDEVFTTSTTGENEVNVGSGSGWAWK